MAGDPWPSGLKHSGNNILNGKESVDIDTTVIAGTVYPWLVGLSFYCDNDIVTVTASAI